MRTNDIRLGNTLNYLDKHQGLKRGFVTYITSGKVVFDHKDSVKTENIMPIPITIEELLALGFKLEYRGGYFDDYVFNGFSIYECKERRYHCIPGKYYVGHDDMLVEYIHDIQNLYYMRTKKELINKYFG